VAYTYESLRGLESFSFSYNITLGLYNILAALCSSSPESACGEDRKPGLQFTVKLVM
jgi:hypothetical protein